MTDETLTPEPDPEDQRELHSEYRIDPAVLGGIIAGTGAALGPSLGALTEHWLEGGDEEPPAPEIELPPGVNTDD